MQPAAPPFKSAAAEEDLLLAAFFHVRIFASTA
jgi:hypothetical protein